MDGWMRHVKREVCLLPVPTRPMSCSHRFLLTTTLSNLPQNVFFFWHPAYEEYILTFSLRFMIVADALHLHTLQPDQRISGSVLRSSSPGPTQCFFLSAPSLPAIQLYIQPIIIAEGHMWILNCWSNKTRCYWCALYSFHHPRLLPGCCKHSDPLLAYNRWISDIYQPHLTTSICSVGLCANVTADHSKLAVSAEFLSSVSADKQTTWTSIKNIYDVMLFNLQVYRWHAHYSQELCMFYY